MLACLLAGVWYTLCSSEYILILQSSLFLRVLLVGFPLANYFPIIRLTSSIDDAVDWVATGAVDNGNDEDDDDDALPDDVEWRRRATQVFASNSDDIRHHRHFYNMRCACKKWQISRSKIHVKFTSNSAKTVIHHKNKRKLGQAWTCLCMPKHAQLIALSLLLIRTTQPNCCFTLTIRSLSETFIRRSKWLISSSGCRHCQVVKWQEPRRTHD